MLNVLLFCFSAEYDHVFSLEEQRKLAEAATEDVAIETNAAYGLRSEDVLSLLEEQMKLADAVVEEVAMEENAAYGLSAEDQLQAEQVTTETNVAYGLQSEIREIPAEQVTESVDHFNSDPQQSPLPDHDSEGYSDYRGLRPVDTTGYANVLHRRSSYETSV